MPLCTGCRDCVTGAMCNDEGYQEWSRGWWLTAESQATRSYCAFLPVPALSTQSVSYSSPLTPTLGPIQHLETLHITLITITKSENQWNSLLVYLVPWGKIISLLNWSENVWKIGIYLSLINFHFLWLWVCCVWVKWPLIVKQISASGAGLELGREGEAAWQCGGDDGTRVTRPGKELS